MAYDLITKKQNQRDWSLGASLTTSTDDVELRLRDLTVDVNNINKDITTAWFPKHRNEEAAKRFVEAWIEWRDRTYEFIRSWKQGGALKIKFAWNYMDNANQKISELADWRSRWERLSGESATAPSTKPPAPPSSGGGIWKWLVAGLVGAVGVVLVQRKIGA